MMISYTDKICYYEQNQQKCLNVEIEADLEELLKSLVVAVPLMQRVVAGDKESTIEAIHRLQERLKMPVSIGRSNTARAFPVLLVDDGYGVDSDIIARVDLTSDAYIIIRAREVHID